MDSHWHGTSTTIATVWSNYRYYSNCTSWSAQFKESPAHAVKGNLWRWVIEMIDGFRNFMITAVLNSTAVTWNLTVISSVNWYINKPNQQEDCSTTQDLKMFAKMDCYLILTMAFLAALYLSTASGMLYTLVYYAWSCKACRPERRLYFM